MEEELWMVAANKVLSQSKKPLHYTEIKRLILEQELVRPGLKTTLEEALFKEIQRPDRRFISVLYKPGVFQLVKSDMKEQSTSAPINAPDNPTPVATEPTLIRKPPIKVKVSTTIPGVKVMTPATSAILHEKYKAKYRRLKCQIKDIMFMNGAVCDEVIKAEEKVQKAKDERRYLLARLLQHQARDESLQQSPVTTQGGTICSSTVVKPTAQSIAQILGEVDKRKKKTVPGLLPSGKKRSAKEILDEAPRPKPRKKGFTGRRTVHQIPLDSLGRPVFPIELGHLTIYCLGEIVGERASFNSTEHIYPAGFCSTRVYASIHHPEEHCLYTCKIIDQNTGPKFDISPEDAPECVFTGSHINECHLKLLRAINTVKGSQIIPLIPRGADFFGLSHPIIQNLIQSCPGAKKCSNYKWQRFEVSRMPPPDINIQEMDEPTVSVDALYALPALASLRAAAQQPPANLRTLLTGTATS